MAKERDLMKDTFLEYIFVIVGAAIVALGFNLFLFPNQVASGGVSGISTILHGLFGWNAGYVQYAFNIPLFIAGVLILGKSFGVKSLIGTLALPFFVILTEDWDAATTDPLLGAIFGGWWNQVMLAQRVTVYAKDREIPGVIASIPPHLLTDAERSKPMDVKNMLIDIGADSKENAMNLGVRPGQSIIPVCPFTPMANPKKIMAKAWDNRYGCGLAIELLKELHGQEVKSHIYSGANVMEEVGLRGAAVSANMIKPDLFFALDASPANDTSGDKTQFGQLGNGPLLRIFDRSMVTHRGMREFILDTAESNNIPYQYFVCTTFLEIFKVVHPESLGMGTEN